MRISFKDAGMSVMHEEGIEKNSMPVGAGPADIMRLHAARGRHRGDARGGMRQLLSLSGQLLRTRARGFLRW